MTIRSYVATIYVADQYIVVIDDDRGTLCMPYDEFMNIVNGEKYIDIQSGMMRYYNDIQCICHKNERIYKIKNRLLYVRDIKNKLYKCLDIDMYQISIYNNVVVNDHNNKIYVLENGKCTFVANKEHKYYIKILVYGTIIIYLCTYGTMHVT